MVGRGRTLVQGTSQVSGSVSTIHCLNPELGYGRTVVQKKTVDLGSVDFCLRDPLDRSIFGISNPSGPKLSPKQSILNTLGSFNKLERPRVKGVDV